MARVDVRVSILDAAERVLARDGLSGATIDAIAAEAGMSKGGVLYHFPNKRKVLIETIFRYEKNQEALREKILPTLPPETPNRFLRANIMAYLELLEFIAEDRHSRLGVLGDPDYRKAIAEMKRRKYKELAKVVTHPDRLATMLFIIDGIWMNRVFRPHVIPKEIEAGAIAEVLNMVDFCCEGSG